VDPKKASIVDSTATSGGGSSPDESFPSLSIRLNLDEQPEKVLRTLREASPPVIGTISADKVHLNLATIGDDEIPHLRACLQKLLGV
jgi:L-seryl-tRNA(Ser) seleniumtransferase